jgi:hypothetical protein
VVDTGGGQLGVKGVDVLGRGEDRVGVVTVLARVHHRQSATRRPGLLDRVVEGCETFWSRYVSHHDVHPRQRSEARRAARSGAHGAARVSPPGPQPPRRSAQRGLAARVGRRCPSSSSSRWWGTRPGRTG